MAQTGIFPAPLEWSLSIVNDGATAVYGNTSTENPFGTWTFQFVPNGSFVGTFGIVGRGARIPTSDTTVPWMPLPYRRVVLNNTAQDYGIVTAQLAGTNDIVSVPANGLAIGILISCQAGACLVRARWSILNSL